MDLLNREGALTNGEIGRLPGLDYSTVSQGRKRLRDRLRKDKKLKDVVSCIEGKLSRIKMRPHTDWKLFVNNEDLTPYI